MKDRIIKTVGELKEIIRDLPDDMLVINYVSDMEGSGYENKNYCRIRKMEKQTEQRYDAFDYTSYTKEVYKETDEGADCLVIS